MQTTERLGVDARKRGDMVSDSPNAATAPAPRLRKDRLDDRAAGFKFPPQTAQGYSLPDEGQERYSSLRKRSSCSTTLLRSQARGTKGFAPGRAAPDRSKPRP